MKIDRLKELIKRIVCESLDALQEEHQTGEWWIDEHGGVTYADGDVGDSNHIAVVVQHLNNEILDHFGIDSGYEGGSVSESEESIKANLIADDNFSEEDAALWESSGPSEVILKKLVEDKVYSTPQQAEDAVYLAYGSSQRDARDYGMQYLNWKIMKTHGGYIEIQTWHLTPSDIAIIVRGIWDIVEDTDDPEDTDNKIGSDGFSGPRINVTIQSNGRRFHDIPLSVLEKKLPTSLMNYRSGLQSDFREGITEDYHFHHKDYRMYEGNNSIVTIFEDNSRLKFEVHFRNQRGPDKERWRQRAMSKWKSIANELHRDVTLSDALNPIQKSWKECFKEALKDPRLKEFIRHNPHHRVFDPVNFTAH
jgi:hypothetical protein